MNQLWTNGRLRWGLVIVWMGVIFMFSAQPATASNQLSGRMAYGISKIVVKDFTKLPERKQESIASKINGKLRKCAHGMIYFVLAILVMAALTVQKKITPKMVCYCLCICFLYACSDEAHQLFVQGRGAQFSDVLIDTLGATIGIVAFVCIDRISKSFLLKICVQ